MATRLATGDVSGPRRALRRWPAASPTALVQLPDRAAGGEPALRPELQIGGPVRHLEPDETAGASVWRDLPIWCRRIQANGDLLVVLTVLAVQQVKSSERREHLVVGTRVDDFHIHRHEMH